MGPGRPPGRPPAADEPRFHRPDGTFKKVRPTGTTVRGDAASEPHTEGGGEEDAIVFFSNRNMEDALYEFLDADGTSFKVLGIKDFRAEYDAQEASGDNTRVATQWG